MSAKKNGPKGSHLFRPVNFERHKTYNGMARRQYLLKKKVAGWMDHAPDNSRTSGAICFQISGSRAAKIRLVLSHSIGLPMS